jgi:hypothetical protein
VLCLRLGSPKPAQRCRSAAQPSEERVRPDGAYSDVSSVAIVHEWTVCRRFAHRSIRHQQLNARNANADAIVMHFAKACSRFLQHASRCRGSRAMARASLRADLTIVNATPAVMLAALMTKAGLCCGIAASGNRVGRALLRAALTPSHGCCLGLDASRAAAVAKGDMIVRAPSGTR